MLFKSRRFIAVGALSLALGCGSLHAQESDPKQQKSDDAVKPSAEEKQADASDEDAEKKPADPFAVPKDAKPDELIAFIKKMATKTPPRTMPERIAHFTKFAAAVMDATELALAAEEIEDDVALAALRFRFQALNLQRQLEIEGVEKVELELATKYSADKREKLATVAKEKLLFARLHNVKELTPEDQNTLVEESIAFVKALGKPSRQSVQMAMQIGNALEEGENLALASTVFKEFGEYLNTSEEKEISRYGVKLLGMSRRLSLTGNELEIEGEMVDGKEFDWSAYRGKVVLVDFWATWCGPCIAELPNVKGNYNGYHTKGFEIVGISLDKDQDRLNAFIKKNNLPWSNLFSTDKENTGWDHPLAVKYGVMGIPFTMLVGKDGKVIAMNVRGPKLGKALAELLGEPDAEALKAASEAKDAEEKNEDE